jgi:ABC-type multidrug transport system fused ATPase/permease subunit
MIAVERVLDYSDLPSEAALTSEEEHRPPNDWPSKGKITGDNVCLRYSNTGPLVLKNIKFCIAVDSKRLNLKCPVNF